VQVGVSFDTSSVRHACVALQPHARLDCAAKLGKRDSSSQSVPWCGTLVLADTGCLRWLQAESCYTDRYTDERPAYQYEPLVAGHPEAWRTLRSLAGRLNSSSSSKTHMHYRPQGVRIVYMNQLSRTMTSHKPIPADMRCAGWQCRMTTKEHYGSAGCHRPLRRLGAKHQTPRPPAAGSNATSLHPLHPANSCYY
jgi:hypothetical protein